MKKTSNQPLIIKKYENRRLYNTLTSEYINQDQVAQLVRDGHDLRVVDAATGQDITRLILAQIVLDDAKTPDSVFPLDLLRQMIIASGKATQVGALRYMKSMMEIYQNAYRAFPLPINPFELMQPGWGAGPSPQKSGHADNSTSNAQQNATAQVEGSRNRSDENELRRRIEELEKALAGRKHRKKLSGTKSRRKS